VPFLRWRIASLIPPLRVTVISITCQGIPFHLLKTTPESSCTPRTPSGKTVLCLKRGPNQRRSGQRTVGQGTTSRCVWITRSSKVSRFARPWGAARVRWRDTYLLNSVRELRQCALLGANPKVIYSGRVFPSLALLWHAGSAEEEAIYLGALKQGLVGLGYIELVDPVDLLPGRRCVASRCRYLLLFNGAGGVLRSTLSGGAVWLR
jgi:hypothetical protein